MARMRLLVREKGLRMMMGKGLPVRSMGKKKLWMWMSLARRGLVMVEKGLRMLTAKGR